MRRRSKRPEILDLVRVLEYCEVLASRCKPAVYAGAKTAGGPLSNANFIAEDALSGTTDAIASGVDGNLPCQLRRPFHRPCKRKSRTEVRRAQHSMSSPHPPYG